MSARYYPGVVTCGEVLFQPAEIWSDTHFFSWVSKRELKPQYPRDWASCFSSYLDDLSARSELYILDLKINTLGAFCPDTWSSLLKPWTLNEILRRSLPVVLLERNLFSIYVSGKHAESTGVWHRFKGQSSPNTKLIIDRSDYLSTEKNWKIEDAALRRILDDYENVVRIRYENLFTFDGFNDSEMAKVLKIFGIDQTAGQFLPDLIRVIDKPLSSIVENYADVNDLEFFDSLTRPDLISSDQDLRAKRPFESQFLPKPKVPVTPTKEKEIIGAPFSPLSRSFYEVDQRLTVCQPLASSTEVQSVVALRSAFRVGDYPDPYVSDVIRAFRLLRGMSTYLEVGTFDRGNLAYVSSILADDACLIGIDVESDDARDQLLRKQLRTGQRYESVTGSSHSPETILKVKDLLNGRKLDAIFIDGDHTAYAVMADYASYEQLISPDGVVLFHDSVWEGDERFKGVADALAEIDKLDPVFLVDGVNPVRRFVRPLFRDPLWGVVGVVFASDQKWRSNQ